MLSRKADKAKFDLPFRESRWSPKNSRELLSEIDVANRLARYE